MMGSSLIIAGTALGAGMLTINGISSVGLLYGTLLMVLICFPVPLTQLYCFRSDHQAGGGLGLNSIARKTLGKQGAVDYAATYFTRRDFYWWPPTILGAGDLLSKLLSNFGVDISATTSQITFTLLAGAVVARWHRSGW